MKATRNKSSLFKKTLLLGLLLFEVIFLAVMEAYKYYHNLDINNFASREFISAFLKSFDITYPGNIFWILLFIASLISLCILFLNLDKIRESTLKILSASSILLLILLVFSILLPTSNSIDEITGKIIQLNAKGTKIISLSLFVFLHIFMIVSLCVISFSALKKFYVFRSIWLTIILVAAGFTVILLSIYFYKDDMRIITSNNLKLDGGVVLGAAVWGGNRPSPVLRERINKGYELLNNGTIKYIILTGGGSPGEMTEAEVAKNELLKKGVSLSNIMAENQSNSTLEQITYVNKNIYKKYNWNKIVIITDNFHLFRSKQICNFFGMNSYTAASDTPLSTESTLNYSIKESFGVILFWLFGMG